MLMMQSIQIVLGMMIFLWLLQANRRNASYVDIGWTLGLAICALVYALHTNGLLLRKMMILMLVCLWAGRLSALLIQRLIKDPSEDSRYAKIRADWKTNQNFKFLAMFLFQGLLDIVLSLPFVLICLNPSPTIAPLEVIGFLISIVGLSGEIIADEQLRAFKAEPSNKGKVCAVGLWNYSRHPNYFFEWVIWFGYFIFALSAPWGFTAIISPLLMIVFLLKVSGIPLAEAQALKTKGEEYRRYQAQTSMFVPLPKRKLS